jgi:hypothetical protein
MRSRWHTGHHFVDYPGHVQAFQHRPHRSQIPELLVLAALRLTSRSTGQLGITSSALPKYCWDTIRGLPSTRADSIK